MKTVKFILVILMMMFLASCTSLKVSQTMNDAYQKQYLYQQCPTYYRYYQH